MRKTLLVGLGVLALLIGGCIHLFRQIDVEEIDPAQPPVRVETSLKVHLLNGDVALFPRGAAFTADSLRGSGLLYPLEREPSTSGTAIDALPLDHVAALETFNERIEPVGSFLASALATSVVAAGSVVLFKAIFGSCPTIYSGTGDEAILEAEAFPNSIVPLFEMRDVDRLGVSPGADHRLALDVRNEALETHYLNHLELVEVTHEPGAFAVPGQRGRALVLHDLTAPTRATDRAGQDVTTRLAAADEDAYVTASQTLDAVQHDDLMDHIDLTVPAPEADTAAVYLRLRNSLLGTVFFYDYMLAAQGARSLDWLGKDMEVIGTAVEMADFYAQRMGLRVQVWTGEAYQEVARVREVGPIAWDHVAVPIPVPPGDSLRIRLHFVADAWRIDRVAVAGRLADGATRVVPLDRVVRDDGAEEARLLDRLARPDEAYLITSPGERFWIHFDVGPAVPGTARTFFLAAQGYYTEWIRGDWVRANVRGGPFEASDATLYAAIERWKGVKDEFEQHFLTSKIPVR